MSHTEFADMLKEYGSQRTSLFVCMTCMETAARHASITWETDAVRTLGREVEWAARWGRAGTVRDDPAAHMLRDELYAIAELIARHQDEFTGILADLAGIPRLGDRRERRNHQTA